MEPNRFFVVLGGRKNANAYAFTVILSVAVWVLDGDFGTYAQWLATGLLGTAFATAWEDRGRGQ